MTSKLTREQLHERARENVKALKMASRQTAFESAREEILADLQLAELALAAMDSEPVAEVLSNRPGNDTSTIDRALPVGTQLYRHAQPAQERDQVRSAHAEWSQATFGNVGPVGPLKHLSKEALEAADQPGDLSEWADMQFLMWDAQRRAGITDEQITQAMLDKLAVNKRRSWPEPKDGEPRLHIKEQPAPVVPEDIPDCVYEILCQACGGNAWMYSDALWNACRAAMLAAAPQSPGSEPATAPGKWISVSERMPEVGVKVLCFPVEDEPIHAVFNGQLWLQDISWSNSDEPIDNVITCNVTHWMPLPAAPREGK